MIKKVLITFYMLCVVVIHADELSSADMIAIIQYPEETFVSFGQHSADVAAAFQRIAGESAQIPVPTLHFLCKEIDAGKTIMPRTLVERALEEAVVCIELLRVGSAETAVDEWAHVLKDYYEELLSNQIDIHTKSPRPGTPIQQVINVDPRYLDSRDLYLRELEVTGPLTAYDLVVTGSPACITFENPSNTILATICATEHALILAPVPPRALQATGDGDLRGISAVDFQMSRTLSNEVASGNYSVIAGGQDNTASGDYSVVSGGFGNTASGAYSFVGGGDPNVASGQGSFVGGGYFNQAQNTYDAVVSGSGNIANGPVAFIGGGVGNYASSIGCVIGGGYNNTASYEVATVAGGEGNTAAGEWSFVGGGFGNNVMLGANYGVVTGGAGNKASASYTFIGSGESNTASGIGAVVVGGGNDDVNIAGNTASGAASFVGGGIANIINTGGSYSGIVSGSGNTVSGGFSFVGGGQGNMATAEGAVVAGGSSNMITGFSIYSVIPGGANNTIMNGNYSLAAGQYANATHNNSFVWSDGTSTLFSSSANHSFNVLATGGVQFATSVNGSGALANGVYLPGGSGGWVNISDKAKKNNFEEVDPQEVLDKVVRMPIEKWTYNSQHQSIRHMGPYAQDFYKAFGLGEDPTGINTVDALGVLFASVQGMYEMYKDDVREMKSQIRKLTKRIKELQEQAPAPEKTSGSWFFKATELEE